MISGGWGEGNVQLSSAEIYDPAGTSGGGCRLANMTTSRYDTVTKDFLVCGGNFGHAEDCVIYDPDSGTWLPAHKLNQDRAG